ncbi:MAG: DUF262 domain-containing protein [Planctomycetes bacterium]|nr:DUF262 domain-containing protein [Planctomycetota bacterium]
MRADAVSLLDLFEKKMRLEVPLFQRQYVWNQAKHWEPLWEDIARKFSEYLTGRKEAPVHFLGAMVLDMKQTPATHVEKRQVIDGQQRLTTLQIFLAALRDFCRGREGCNELADEIQGFTLNTGKMPDPETDKFKVWPTQLDRAQFVDVVTSGSREVIEAKHPRVRQYRKKKYDPRPRMVEAYVFFSDQIADFFVGKADEPPLAVDTPLEARLDECFQALKHSLQVVEIDLEPGDDAQVIFETLNARGEPLLPADLLRNYIFLRAARGGENQEALYNKYWRGFDDPFWRVEVKQGRLNRPRSDLFMQHYLSSRLCVDIPVTHLFVEYKFWIDHQTPFTNVTTELESLSTQGADFRRIMAPEKGDEVFELSNFLRAFDVSTSYPLLLAMMDAKVDDDAWRSMASLLESYLVRRAVCGLTTKNYNRVFLTVTRNLRRGGMTPENLRKALSEQWGESTEWPSDEKFAEAWKTCHAYSRLNNPKLVHVLKRINQTYMSSKTEALSFDEAPTVEHIMPQQWEDHWPLPDGQQGMKWEVLYQAPEGDLRAEATRKRNAAMQTIGNLTILTQALNSAASNSAWKEKKLALMAASLLPINLQLQAVEAWTEQAIELRSKDMLTRALEVWPRP